MEIVAGITTPKQRLSFPTCLADQKPTFLTRHLQGSHTYHLCQSTPGGSRIIFLMVNIATAMFPPEKKTLNSTWSKLTSSFKCVSSGITRYASIGKVDFRSQQSIARNSQLPHRDRYKLKNSTIAIAGFGAEGKSAYKFFMAVGATVDVYDEKPSDEHPENTTVSIVEEWDLDGYDLIIRSPSLSPHRLKTTAQVSSVSQLFLELTDAKIIGITGTKGKGTTASLIAEILSEAKIENHLLGNIGKPALSELEKIKTGDIVVYEMSSFQLWDMTLSPHIAVVLMMEPEHLDVHKDLDDYINAKANIAKHQSAKDITIMHPSNEMSARVGRGGNGVKKKYMASQTARIDNSWLVVGREKIMPVRDFGLVGLHNHENICAALTAAWEFTQDTKAAKRAIRNFTGLEHRLEFVKEVQGVKYYNDSFATIPGATIAAISSFDEGKIVLILGGSDKQSDYSYLAKSIALRANINRVILIGDMAETIDQALKSAGYNEALKMSGDFESTIAKAAEFANQGDTVLLSPACASFGMFKDYKQRGELFRQIVSKL